MTHLGVEMQTKIENGYRKFETIYSLPESKSLVSNELTEGFEDKSPFASFLFELKRTHYKVCDELTHSDREMCEFEIRKKVLSVCIDFIISYIPNYPDQIGKCSIT